MSLVRTCRGYIFIGWINGGLNGLDVADVFGRHRNSVLR
jgi:hypothetical protein